jgi:hypothetical protein
MFMRLYLAYAILVALGVYSIERRYHFGFQGTDDANIFFGYAKNLLSGHGLVYSPSGDPVEGFTSALWFAVCAYAALFRSHSDSALLSVNVALAAASLTLVTLGTRDALRRVGLSRTTIPIVVLVSGVALSHPGWLIWNVTCLMDSGLYAFCLSLAWYGLVQLRVGRKGAGALLGWSAFLLILCRPEGVGWFVLLLVWLFLLRQCALVSTLKASETLRRMLLSGGITYGALLLWRWLTFHALLPNPLYAKVSAPLPLRLSAGADYIGSYVELHAYLIAFAFVLPVVVWTIRSVAAPEASRRLRRWQRRRVGLLLDLALPLVFVTCAWAVPLMAGGDVFGAHRFCQTVHLLLIPPIAIGLALTKPLWARLAQGRSISSNGIQFALGTVALVPLLWLPSHWRHFGYSNGEPGGQWSSFEHVRSEYAIAQADRLHGARIAEALATRLPRIAYAAAGGISVGYPGVIYDMMGLNDPVLAHRCQDKVGPTGHACFERERFYELQPDALLPRAIAKATELNLMELDWTLRRPGNWDNRIFRDLFNEPLFREQYRMARIVPAQGPWSVYGYFSVRYLLDLVQDPHFQLVFP